MAEVAGLVLGAVGIAGVIGVFKDTVEVFNLIADSRQLGRDYEILETKLDIEKTLLLLWAKRVKLLSPDYDRRLDDPDIQKLVVRMLGCITTLFADVPDITTRYGLDNSRSDKDLCGGSDLITTTPRISDSRWQDFLSQYQTLRSSNEGKRLPAPFFKRARWIIRDKSKFEILIHEVAHFTAKINEVVPVVTKDSYTSMLSNKDISTIHDLRKLKIIEEASIGSRSTIAALAQNAIAEACKDRILNKLWFRKIDDRRESIQVAHGKTLQWALSPPNSEAPWDDLSEWVRSGSGIYWISGKAGSGKSTLMKHLYMDKRIKKLLSQWAGGEDYTLCSYFFMNLGTVEQKSQEGLSRTLLYQILSANRDLIPETLPSMWKEIHDRIQNSMKADIDLPSSAELKKAFDAIAYSCDRIGRFCFLIDGMDEFVGNYREGIAFIRSLACNEHIKIIISSRPIPSCVAAFTNSPKLRLQDLNRDDIVAYVDDIIGRHEYMISLAEYSAHESQNLMHDIVEKSSGVFLWVVLACRSLLSGFDDHDSISELQRRVDELPPELEELFQHMLNKIDKVHREEGAKLLRICHTKQVSQWFDQETTILAFGLAMVADYISSRFQNHSFKEVKCGSEKAHLCKILEGRLRSRCGGLLEVYRDSKIRKIHGEVRFMHRTVFEFLNNEETWELECLQLPTTDTFDVATALSLYGLHIALESLTLSEFDLVSKPFWEGLRWAVMADKAPDGNSGLYLDNIDTFINHRNFSHLSTKENTFRHLSWLKNVHPDHVQLLFAIEAGAVNYVRGRPHLGPIVSHDNSDRGSCGCLPILWHAMHKEILTSESNKQNEACCDRWGLPSRDMIESALIPGLHTKDEIPVLLIPWMVWLEYEGYTALTFNNSDKIQFLLLVEVILLDVVDSNIRNIVSDVLLRYLNDKNSSEQVRKEVHKILPLIPNLSKNRREVLNEEILRIDRIIYWMEFPKCFFY